MLFFNTLFFNLFCLSIFRDEPFSDARSSVPDKDHALILIGRFAVQAAASYSTKVYP